MKPKKSFIGPVALCVLGSVFLSFFSFSCAAKVPAATQKTEVSSRYFEMLFGEKRNPVRYVIPGGQIFGLRMDETEITVTDVADLACGLKPGDVILNANDTPVRSVRDLTEAIRHSDGILVLTVQDRDGRRTVSLPLSDTTGEKKIGISVRTGTAGIGTVTFTDPQTGSFGGLGHSIGTCGDGSPISAEGGTVTEVILGGVKKGTAGDPGELRGVLKRTPIGEICANSVCGVFGRWFVPPDESKTVPVADENEIVDGEATVLSTVKNGVMGAYTIQIRKIGNSPDLSKSFRVRITDPTLIAQTGGIVRGMSGSPILQNGKIIGALTHVMVNDPTEGYGIYIGNMLRVLDGIPLPKAA